MGPLPRLLLTGASIPVGEEGQKNMALHGETDEERQKEVAL